MFVLLKTSYMKVSPVVLPKNLKIIINLIFIGLFCCCNSSKNSKVDTIINTPVSSYKTAIKIPCIEDSIVKTLLNNGSIADKGWNLISDPKIENSSGYSNEFSFTHYQLYFKGNSYAFVDTFFEKNKMNKQNFYLNKKPLNVCNVKNNTFNLDSMEMQIDYKEALFYDVKNNSSYLLIKSIPMNWVGSMSKFSFFQLIYLKENLVFQFISEG
jgi:hypothetical protein